MQKVFLEYNEIVIHEEKIMGEMGMNSSESLQAKRAESKGDIVENDMRIGAEIQEMPASPQETIDFEKKKRAVEYANKIAELQKTLERARADMENPKNLALASIFQKVIASLEEDIKRKEIEFAGEAGTDIAQ